MQIKIDKLTKSFDDKTLVLEDISLHDEVESLALIGPSGCGKSTFLRIVGGLIPKTSGSVSINHAVLPDSENELVEYRKQVGFVFQQSGLFDHISALENIALPLIKVHKWSIDDANREALNLLERLGIAEHAHKRPHELSGGQKQRVAIARAIAPKPKLLLFDEPTSALDPEYTTEVLDVIKELKYQGVDFIIVTHEMGFARHACDKVAFMYDGVILEYGASQAMFETQKSDAFKKFLGNLLEWQV